MRRKVHEQYCGKEFTIINFKGKELLNPFTESRLKNNVFFTELGCVLLEAVEKQVWIMGVAEDGTTVLIIYNWRGSYIGDNEHGQLYYATGIKRA